MENIPNMDNMDFASVGMMNDYTNVQQDPRTKTGWWSTLTGGKTEKESLVAQQDYDKLWNEQMFEREMAYNSAEMQKQRDYETMMSNSAYTRAMKDMKNAGLNPALMYARGGMSASTPSSGNARTSAPSSNSAKQLPSQTGQLAGIIGTIAFASAKAVTSAYASMKVGRAMKGYQIGSGSKALNNFYKTVGI